MADCTISSTECSSPSKTSRPQAASEGSGKSARVTAARVSSRSWPSSPWSKATAGTSPRSTLFAKAVWSTRSEPVDGEAHDPAPDLGGGRLHCYLLDRNGLGHGALDVEVGLLAKAVLLEQHGVLLHVEQLDVHRDGQAILPHGGLRVVRDLINGVGDHLALQDRVGVFALDQAEPPVGGEGREDSVRHQVLDPGRSGLVDEERHRDGLEVLRKGPVERIPAAGDGGGEQSERKRAAYSPHARVTMLTRRLGTTTTFSTRRCPSHGLTRSSPRASWRTRSSAAST